MEYRGTSHESNLHAGRPTESECTGRSPADPEGAAAAQEEVPEEVQEGAVDFSRRLQSGLPGSALRSLSQGATREHTRDLTSPSASAQMKGEKYMR